MPSNIRLTVVPLVYICLSVKRRRKAPTEALQDVNSMIIKLVDYTLQNKLLPAQSCTIGHDFYGAFFEAEDAEKIREWLRQQGVK